MEFFQKNKKEERIITFTADEANLMSKKYYNKLLKERRKKFWNEIKDMAQLGKHNYSYKEYYYGDSILSNSGIGYQLLDIYNQIKVEFEEKGFKVNIEDNRLDSPFLKNKSCDYLKSIIEW